MLEKYKDGQPIAYNLMINAVENNKLSHAYLFEASDNIDISDLVLSFVKAILCPNHYVKNDKCGNCAMCKRIDDNNYLELKIIEPEGLWIRKEQILDLQKVFSTKAIEGTKKIYIIKDCEKMKPATSNSLLKFLEEPEENIIAILITNNVNKVLRTIVSRCQIINVVKNNNKYIYENNELYSDALDFISFYEKYRKDTIIYLKKEWHQKFKTKEENDYVLTLMINFYYDVLNYKSDNKIKIFDKNVELIENSDKNNSIDDIIKRLEVLIETKELLRCNLNINLLIDKMIIDFGGD